MRITFAHLSLSRKIPRAINSLKVSDFTNLNNFTEMLNGPVDFPFFKEMMISSISKSVTGKMKKEFIFFIFQVIKGLLFCSWYLRRDLGRNTNKNVVEHICHFLRVLNCLTTSNELRDTLKGVF